MKALKDLKIGDEWELIKGLKGKLKKIKYFFENDEGTEIELTLDKPEDLK